MLREASSVSQWRNKAVSFGTKLREYREPYGVSQVILARRANISPKYLSRIEMEKLPAPGKNVIHSLRDLMKIN